MTYPSTSTNRDQIISAAINTPVGALSSTSSHPSQSESGTSGDIGTSRIANVTLSTHAVDRSRAQDTPGRSL